MAKTLVIKGASYSDNKLATVQFISSVPCTGISFSSSTISINGYTPTTIQHTVTPSDTTDAVTWASSNTNVATVSDGVVTPVGVGTCTITAMCGSYSATATVTVTMSVELDLVQKSPSVNSSAHVLFTSTVYSNYFTLIGKEEQATQYLIYDATPANSAPAIKLPKNTGRVKISATSTTALYNYESTNLYWLKDESAGWSNYPDAAYYVSSETAYNICTEKTKVFTVPTGVNAMTVKGAFSSDQSSVESALATLASAGFEIEFLPAA